MDTPHFYAISRRDLPTHQQAIQSAHAQLEFVRSGGLLPEEHPSFVWLTVEDKWELLQLATVLSSHDIDVQEFHDLDYKGYDPSAIACLVEEKKRYLLSHLPLWKCEKPHEAGWFEKIHRALRDN
jgi:hypothetical protein